MLRGDEDVEFEFREDADWEMRWGGRGGEVELAFFEAGGCGWVELVETQFGGDDHVVDGDATGGFGVVAVEGGFEVCEALRWG